MDYMNWMYDTVAIHDTQLRHICLPTSHDSGTSNLSLNLAFPLDDDEKEMMGLMEMVAGKISAISEITRYIPDPTSWVAEVAMPLVKGLMTTMSRTVAQQLADGIRCLDLRIYGDDTNENFYTYHTLIGSPMDDVLGQIEYFLSQTKGEILYVTLSHYRSKSGEFNNFRSQVEQCLSAYAYKVVGAGSNSPLFQTYNEMVSAQTPGSKVILVDSQTSDYADGSIFWPIDYSPADSENSSPLFAGTYSNTSDQQAMIDDQYSKFRANALGKNLPFALFMLLTPQDDDVAAILANALAQRIEFEAAIIAQSDPVTAGQLLQVVSAVLQKYMHGMWWDSIAQLCAPLNSQLTNVIQNQFLAGWRLKNPLSWVYVDFYETTDIVAQAINYSQNIFK